MTFSYSGDPSTSDIDHVRFLLQDTDCNDPRLQDEEIMFLLTQNPDPRTAAAEGAERIAAHYARLTDFRIGDYNESASKYFEHYTKLAKQLKGDALKKLVLPYAGGLSKNEKRTDRNDTDLTQPIFRKGQFNNRHF